MGRGIQAGTQVACYPLIKTYFAYLPSSLNSQRPLPPKRAYQKFMGNQFYL